MGWYAGYESGRLKVERGDEGSSRGGPSNSGDDDPEGKSPPAVVGGTASGGAAAAVAVRGPLKLRQPVTT